MMDYKVEYYINDAALHELNYILYKMGYPQLEKKSFQDWVYELARANMRREVDEWYNYDPENDLEWHAIITGMERQLHTEGEQHAFQKLETETLDVCE